MFVKVKCFIRQSIKGPVVSKNEMLSSLLSSCPIPSCEEQGDQIRPYLTEPKHLKRGDKWLAPITNNSLTLFISIL